MQILLAALTCLLLHSTFSSSIIIPQVPLCYAPTTEASYGYAGPGVYRILSYVNSYAVSLNTSDSTTGLVSRPPVADDDAQRWLIADVSATEKMIINNGTGSILCAIKGQSTTRATFTPPYDLTGRWTIDFDRYKDYTGSPVMLTNVGRKNTVLDLSRSRKGAGTPVISYPINKPRTKNQAWLLEYLEAPAPPPTPPPPPAPTCDYPETPQQALRGNIISECASPFSTVSQMENAEECYEYMKNHRDPYDGHYYNLKAYVFTSEVNPGSPEGPGFCQGYKNSSSHFFVGNSSGDSFGGDTALPFN